MYAKGFVLAHTHRLRCSAPSRPGGRAAAVPDSQLYLLNSLDRNLLPRTPLRRSEGGARVPLYSQSHILDHRNPLSSIPLRRSKGGARVPLLFILDLEDEQLQFQTNDSEMIAQFLVDIVEYIQRHDGIPPGV